MISKPTPKAIIYVLTLIFTFSPIYAADIKVTCNENSDCKQSPSNKALFTETQIKPYWSISKTIEISNKHNKTRTVTMRIKDLPHNSFDPPGSLSEVMNVKIKEKESGKEIWAGSLKEMNEVKSIRFTDIPKRSSRTYIFLVSLGDVGNEYQAKKVKFDLHLNFKSENGNNFFNDKPDKPKNEKILGSNSIRNFFNYCKNQYFTITSKHRGKIS
jgi:hypothetical protein